MSSSNNQSGQREHQYSPQDTTDTDGSTAGGTGMAPRSEAGTEARPQQYAKAQDGMVESKLYIIYFNVLC